MPEQSRPCTSSWDILKYAGWEGWETVMFGEANEEQSLWRKLLDRIKNLVSWRKEIPKPTQENLRAVAHDAMESIGGVEYMQKLLNARSEKERGELRKGWEAKIAERRKLSLHPGRTH